MSNDGGGTDDARGRLVGGRYRLVERIGSGGTGTVWRAHDELVQREVAVRQPRLPGEPEDESHRRAAHRLHREARAAARVDHPGAVAIHDVVVEPERHDDRPGPKGPDELDAAEALDGLPWIVMELVPGESLHETLRRGPVDVDEAARIGLWVLGALRAAHSVGIVHRDVKPANVLLAPEPLQDTSGQRRPPRVVVTDFGIAHAPGEEGSGGSGEFSGSPEFVAPERLSGRIAGPASDLWSLGVLLYTAVEGVSPFGRATGEDTAAAVLAAAPPEPQRAGPLGPLIVRLLAPDPQQRPDAADVARELEAVAGPLPLTPAAPTPPADRAAEDAPEPAAGPGPQPPADTAPAAEEPPRRHGLLRPAPLALLGALLAGGMGAATQFADTSSAESAGPAADTTDTWTPHPEPDLAAVLHLPRHYRPLDRTGGAAGSPRTVLYGDERGGTIRLRLLYWDKAPATPMEQARRTPRAGGETRYTRTGVQGREAVLADTAYDRGEDPRRDLRVLVRTDDDRLYELRVDMPRGTPEEEEGTALFRGARDRLGMAKG
ncbi:serine/threonine-protein kinase [Streptomyces sp. bgisy032]|uniref:serine/threonine-protein kinase n=1 Tax=Streptomyces sp. bgisy032 TaxID=3413773 RepID=UPI003D70532C